MKSYCKGLRVDHALVWRAYCAWCEAESGRKNRWRVVEEYGSEEALVDEIAREVRQRELRLRPIKTYDDRSSKKTRHIGQQSVKQQVLDYVAVIAMEDFLAAKIGHYQVSSMKGKGSVFGSKVVRRWLSEGRLYWVHLDVRKCYENIGHGDVFEILNKYIRSNDVLYVCDALLATYEKGLMLGSYFSLKMSQLVLSFGYHHVEGLRSSRRGVTRPMVTHQIWYADDIYLFSTDKRNLKKAVLCLSAKMQYRAGLRLKPWKVCVSWKDEPTDIAAFVCTRERTTLRSDLYLRLRRAFQRFDAQPSLKRARSVCSYWGWLKHSSSRKAVEKNGYDRIFHRAKRYVSNRERKAITLGPYAVV